MEISHQLFDVKSVTLSAVPRLAVTRQSSFQLLCSI